MNQDKQPEALRLADWLDAGGWPSYVPQESAAELRRLHACVQKSERDRQIALEISDTYRKMVAELQLEAAQAQRAPIGPYELREILKRLNASHDEEGWNFGDLAHEVEVYHGITQEKQGCGDTK